MSGIIVTVAPTKKPLTLAEVKAHCRITHTDEDIYLDSLIDAAANHAESVTKTALMQRTVNWNLDYFPCFTMEFPVSPVQSVTFVKYKHPTTGVLTTLDSSEYLTDTISMPARIQPAYGKVWPTTREELNAVKIEFVAGYSNAKDVPFNIRQAMLMMISHWYENRETTVSGTIMQEVPQGAAMLLHTERVWAL